MSWSLPLNPPPTLNKSPTISILIPCGPGTDFLQFLDTPFSLFLEFHISTSLCPSPGWVCWQVMSLLRCNSLRKLPYPLCPTSAKLFQLDAPPLSSYSTLLTTQLWHPIPQDLFTSSFPNMRWVPTAYTGPSKGYYTSLVVNTYFKIHKLIKNPFISILQNTLYSYSLKKKKNWGTNIWMTKTQGQLLLSLASLLSHEALRIL